jgi:hypothetical protein
MSTTTQGSLEQSKTPLIVHDTGSSVARSVVATNTTRKPGKSTVTITTLNAPPPSTIASSKPSFFIQNAVALDPTIVTNAAMAAANIWNPTYVLRPHFNDVIFPVEDYPMWIGNIKFRNEVIKRQLQFYNSVDRAEQAKLALEIVHSIQEQRPPGRFVLALPWRPPSAVIVEGAQMQRDNNNNNHKKPGPGGLPPYLENTIFQVMNETDVLIQLGKHLRRIECHRVKRFIKKKKKRTPKNNNPEILKHKYADFFLDSDDEEEEEEKEENDQEEADAVPTKKIPIESLGPLQVLYYVPQHHQQQRQNKYQNSTTGKHYPDDAVSMQSSNASSSSPSQLRKKRNKQAASRRFATNEPLSKKFRTEPKPQTGATVEESTQSLVVVVPPPLTGQFEEGKNDTNKAKEKPPKATSLMVLSQNEGTNILPKGVTVRPSGKWVRTKLHTFLLRCCSLVSHLILSINKQFTGFFALFFLKKSKLKPTLQDSHDTWVCTTRACWRHTRTTWYKAICQNTERNTR